MADWSLTFGETRPITIEMCEHVLSGVAGGPVNTDIGEFTGNPRDGYIRGVTITAQRPGGEMRLEMRLTQSERGPGDPLSHTSIGIVTLHAPAASFATKLATRHALRDALADIGCTDHTLVSMPAPIVDEAEAAGETATAARLRADITAALVAEAPSCRHVSLMSTRAEDIEAVLAAYVDPQAIRTVIFHDCGLNALPAGFARFPNVESLTFVENDIDGRALRGVSLPSLTNLYMGGSGIRQMSRADLAGFPMLARLLLQESQLRELDPDIIEVCQKLRRVLITNTPLARDARKIAALRARWKDVAWQ